MLVIIGNIDISNFRSLTWATGEITGIAEAKESTEKMVRRTMSMGRAAANIMTI
jgi:hypothetical protein